MFISSYNTYVGTSSSDKTSQRNLESKRDESKSFSSKLAENAVLESHVSKNLPIDYVSNYKSFNTQQKLQEQIKSPDETKFKNIKNINSAKVAYEEGSRMFPLFKKQSSALSQPVKRNTELPQNIQELKEESLRHIMVNTYIANDKYYQITA
ncbi:MAG: hypothetical protein KAR81_04800 [Sulfurimonas sp.]|nr:hypothetical protein [Sulfurimonas sp.]